VRYVIGEEYPNKPINSEEEERERGKATVTTGNRMVHRNDYYPKWGKRCGRIT
jgi:hypothetical protein